MIDLKVIGFVLHPEIKSEVVINYVSRLIRPWKPSIAADVLVILSDLSNNPSEAFLTLFDLIHFGHGQIMPTREYRWWLCPLSHYSTFKVAITITLRG